MDYMDQMSQCVPKQMQDSRMPREHDCAGQTPGMAYVPWQHFTKTYDPQKALQAGTIFPELDKPFTGKCMMRQGGRCR